MPKAAKYKTVSHDAGDRGPDSRGHDHTRRVLVVDGSCTLSDRVRKIVADLGIAVDVADSGQQAVVACGDRRPDLVIVNGGMSGSRDVQAFRQLRDAPPPKVLFCAGDHLFDRVWQALADGADEYLLKPFNDTALIAKMSLLGILDGQEAERCMTSYLAA